MSKGKLFLLGTIAVTVWGLMYFRGDIQRYTKMKMM
jgi:hypothetical protein